MRIFMSHSSRDKPLIREVAHHFPPWLKTWLDEERLLFGSELAPSLRDAIDTHVDYVVLFAGQEAVESGWIRQEIAWALDRERELGRTFLLPVLVTDVRSRLSELGLEGRLTLEVADFTAGSSRSLAERISSHVAGWMSERLASLPADRPADRFEDDLSKLAQDVVSLTDEIPRRWRGDVAALLMRPFIGDLAPSRIGIVTLNPAQYYQRINGEMSRAGADDSVLAISTLSSELWKNDPDQKRYLVRNFEAIRRGTRIRRLFILPETQGEAFEAAIRRQEEQGIEVRVAGMRILAQVPSLQDCVLFDTAENPRAYVSQPSIDGSQSIRCGTLTLSDYALARLRDTFYDAWELALDPEQYFGLRRGTQDALHPRRAPGLDMKAHHLQSPVVTCEEAARARGVSLERELKTLLLRTNRGMVAAHLPGDGVLSLRKVKTRLESSEAYLADPEDLLHLGLSSGTVSAVLEPVWSMPHLVSRRLLELKDVTTNNGTRTGYFIFDPAVLTEAAQVVVAELEK